MNSPRLIDTTVPKDPEAAVLVLHGGASRRDSPMVSPTQLSVLRMVPIARRLAQAGRGRLAVFRLLNSTRGWDAHQTPVDDVAWAIEELGRRLGTALPTGLVGHSLGGRAALLAGARPDVSTVVALNPWVYPSDGDHGLPGTRALIVHGTDDRIADPARSAHVARVLGRSGPVGYVRVEGGKHAMLRRRGVFDGLAAEYCAATMLGDTPGPTLAKVLAGDPWVDV